jgi:hypothetical protein
LEEIDPYKILDVSKDASSDEIKTAYRNLIKHYHPDRVATLPREFRELAHEKMVELNIAYEMLTHPERFVRNPTIRKHKPPPKSKDKFKRCPFCSAKNRIPEGMDIDKLKCGKCGRGFKDKSFKSYGEKYEKNHKTEKAESTTEPKYIDYEDWKKKKGIHIENAEKNLFDFLNFGDPFVWIGILFCLFVLFAQAGTILGFFSPESQIASISRMLIILVITASVGFLTLYIIDKYLKIEAYRKFGFSHESRENINELICMKCGGAMKKSEISKFSIPGIVLMIIVVAVFLIVLLFIVKNREASIISMILAIPVIIFLVFITATTKKLWICMKCGEKTIRTT